MRFIDELIGRVDGLLLALLDLAERDGEAILPAIPISKEPSLYCLHTTYWPITKCLNGTVPGCLTAETGAPKALWVARRWRGPPST